MDDPHDQISLITSNLPSPPFKTKAPFTSDCSTTSAAPAPCPHMQVFSVAGFKKNDDLFHHAPGMIPVFRAPNLEKRQEVIWSCGPPPSAARLLGHTPWPWRCPPRRPTWRCSRPCMAQRPAGPQRCSGYGERRNATWRPMHLGKTWGSNGRTCVTCEKGCLPALVG